MKSTRSIIIEKSGSITNAFHYRVYPADRILVNLYFRHYSAKNEGKKVSSVKRAAFQISATVPSFDYQSLSYTRPVRYYTSNFFAL